jgi:hypothetical protein
VIGSTAARTRSSTSPWFACRTTIASVAALSTLVAGVMLIGCSKRAAAGAAGASESSGQSDPPAPGADAPPTDPRERQAWAQAEEGGDDEQMRLADLVGCEGLRERAANAALRSTAIRAMAYCPDLSDLAWLASVARSSDDGAERTDALDVIVEQAARPRRATDPEDAVELGEGCRTLVALARAGGQPRAERVLAVRALRMLVDRGCAKKSDIPADLDAK